jgi:dimethylsulfoniopropionate demethylase
MVQLSISRRLRGTPYTARLEAWGVEAYTVYNHMLLPTVIDSLEEDYHHLKKDVQVWDVSCERQIEVRGPDAEKMIQLMTPRDLGKAKIDQCFYIPLIDERGGMLNDPVAIKLADDRYWISIADSDVLLWAKGLAYGFRFEVEIEEPDVNILAVQGPKSDDLMARVFGEAARTIRFFRGLWLPFEGQSIYVARSGYSKQGGFEIYLEDRTLAEPLWDALFAAGEDLNVRPGGPNAIERVEGGLLSYGNDMTRENTPFECGLGRFCDVEESIGCVGRDALLRDATDGPMRMIRGLAIEGERVPTCRDPWVLTTDGGEYAGQVTSAAWSPDFETNVSIGMVERDFWRAGQTVWVTTPDGERRATVHDLPFTT